MQQAGLSVSDRKEPIPTDFGDIEDERRRMEKLVAALLWAFALAVGSAFTSLLTICGPVVDFSKHESIRR